MNKHILPVLLASTLAAPAVHAAYSFTNDQGDSLTIDGRFEARYQDKGGDADSEWNSGSSRLGIKGIKQLQDGWKGFGHAEWGYNSGSNGDNIYDRLLYAGVEHQKYGKISVGTKQWSSFYDVAWFTDMGRTYGTRGSGVYNLSDWGISSGTGRAANSVVYRNKVGDALKLGFTYQTTRSDVSLSGSGASAATATLKQGLGASALYSLTDKLNIGAAYHQNELDDLKNANNARNGDKSRIALLGLNYTDGGLYLGATFSQGYKWEISDANTFFDSRGGEFYTYYHFNNGWRPTLNINYLSDTDNKANGYKRLTYVPGIEYHFLKNEFIVWAEYQVDEGKDKLVDGKFVNRSNQMSAGIRYYF